MYVMCVCEGGGALLLILPRGNILNNVISKYLLNIIMGQAHSRGDQGPNRARPLWRQCSNKMRCGHITAATTLKAARQMPGEQYE